MPFGSQDTLMSRMPDYTGQTEVTDFALPPAPTAEARHATPTRMSIEDTFESAKEEQTRCVTANMTIKAAAEPAVPSAQPSSPAKSRTQSPVKTTQPLSPKETSKAQPSPTKKPSEDDAAASSGQPEAAGGVAEDAESNLDMHTDETRSSDGSSPIRPVVRKSSLNFASLPAREPLTSNKSLGHRVSRVSNLDHARASYYQRHTGGKSLGISMQLDTAADNHDDMDVDVDEDDVTIPNEDVASHNKTYTQRLQDQITLLGKSQSSGARPSKSLANLLPTQQPGTTQPAEQPQTVQAPSQEANPPSPSEQHQEYPATPGAFPDEDDDDWISPPASTRRPATAPSPRPALAKSYSTDVMENVHGKETVGGSAFVLPKSRLASPEKAPPSAAKPSPGTPSHGKSASVPSLPAVDNRPQVENAVTPPKPVSVSNPSHVLSSDDDVLETPSKSPSRTFRDSPLKQVKNKLSSILKGSRGLLASSAALSAEGKSSLISPSMTRITPLEVGQSAESLNAKEPLYPNLPRVPSDPERPQTASGTQARKTRASAEREKREAKEKEKETKEREKEQKEAKRLAERMEKLEKVREKEREKARVFSQEQDKTTEMEKRVADQKEQAAAAQVQVLETPAPPPKSPTKAMRTSPRRTKAQGEAEAGKAAAATTVAEPNAAEDDVEMIDASTSRGIPRPSRVAPPSAPRSLKRPTKPTKEIPVKAKQAPTVIRVNTTSTQQSQFHPSNSVLAATLQDTLGPQPHGSQRGGKPGLQTKPSLQSLKSSTSSSGRPKALDLAAKRKEQEEREAQRKREAKLEMERKRAAAQEEERKQEQQRRQEIERQREAERKQAAAAAQAKKDAQRQAAIEKAKQTRAPPPAARPQANTASEYNSGGKAPTRPGSRLGSILPQEGGRPVNAVLSNTSKAGPKRPLQDNNNEDAARTGTQRSGLSYQSKDSKRLRMSEEFDDDIEMADSQPHIMKGPPVRPSANFKKVRHKKTLLADTIFSVSSNANHFLLAPLQDLTAKQLFTNGYTPAPQGVTRDLFKTTVTAQHNSQAKASHPMEMAQFSKGAIPFAANPSAGGGQPFKTPARPAGAPGGGKSTIKSTARSSPRFPNGEAIELPEIETDDEDEDDGHFGTAAWADSPEIRRALMQQETIDPMRIFGAPAPLNMEEVFHKSQERFHKFRARTSSANWSGTDKLTEEDIRKDLQARDRMRREGGWSYELNRDGLV